MDLFDFFFPEQAAAAHLRKIANKRAFMPSTPGPAIGQADEIAALRADVNFLTMVLTAVLKRLAETRTMSLADVQDLLDDVDGLDGTADSGLDPGVLRGLLGVLKHEEPAESADEAAFRSIAEAHRRYRH